MNDGETGIFIGVIIIILILLFVGVIALAVLATDRTNGGAPVVDVETGAFLAPCTTTPCQDDLICDGNTFTCRRKVGDPCLDATDCVTGLICSGRCATGATGSLNAFCPCGPNYQCEPDTCNSDSGYTVCKAKGGVACSQNCDCVSTICQSDGTCAAGAPNAYPCSNNDICASQNCSLGYCQPPGVTTGVIGASCATADAQGGQFCGVTGLTGGNPGANCAEGLLCDCDINGLGSPGVCIGANQGILSSCNLPASGCSEELICLNGTGPNIGLECTGGTGSCLCVFPYENPNQPSVGLACIGGMTMVNGQCYNNTGLGCGNGGMCLNGNCGGGSVMAIYRFDGSLNPTTYPGALNTEIIDGFPGPAGTIAPYKMFATSAGAVDTIYLVDSLQGLLQTTVGPQITPTWTLLIPHLISTASGTRTLIDVGYNGITYLVAFDEVATGGQNSTVYTWDGTPYPAAVFTPYNVIAGSGIPGTQYRNNNQPITISYIDISPINNGLTGGANPPVPDTGNDVLLVEMPGTVYVKTAAEGQTYSQGVIRGGDRHGAGMTGVGGLTRFYYDVEQTTGDPGPPVCPENCTTQNHCPSQPIDCPSYYNIALIGSYRFRGSSTTFPDVLQFSGNIAGIALPLDQFRNVVYEVFDFSIYSPPGTGMNGSSITILAHAYDGSQYLGDVVAISFAGVTAIMPYQIDSTYRSVATANAYYILSPQSCG